ncbi:asparagine synthase (glutamine-hydrolyzing) [Streptomyces sp. CB04723]|uniref:asparagine synthase (glutamine-hydrolyzing) n=1 Tax=Streptomyces TaxID=1883 RepID=UPI0015C48DB7|nr:asparagine synthase (glutamine-hydrolyzing) [Streptomyces sp. CB04723]QLG31890.1 asparagine synthase (glutamine-hydrolyzing) [Streptomyces sp. CB04723]
MCGLAGFARLDGQSLGPEYDALLTDFADLLHHRGPDERELLRSGPVGLAFTRLSLVNPQDGTQPLVSDDGNLVLIANGEVYNHKELAAGLPSGTRLRTGSDCEVLLHLYRQHSLDFLRDVRGMFAIILWDRTREQLVLARDRFGIKPLYYHRSAERIVLSSEIKALFADPATPRRFAWEKALATPAVAAAPRFGAEHMCTWFEGVESVPAATVLRVDLRGGRTTEHRYWELPTEPDESTSAEGFVERYAELLETSVRDCATADTELGLFLSGGIDSSIVLALARTQVEDIHTFTALSGATLANGDAEHAGWLSRQWNVHNHQVLFEPGLTPTPEEWRRLVWLTESPMVGPEVYYKHELHRFARQLRPQLRGMLLGAASDEFNGGYSHDMGEDWGDFVSGLDGMRRATGFDRQPFLRHWCDENGSFLSDEALNFPGSEGSADVYASYVLSEYRKVQQYNVWHEDRTAAGSGVEARVPFLDHRIVELTSSIPGHMRPRLLWDKRILRDAVGSLVPRRIAERPKVPFFYGSGTHHAYGMLVRLMNGNGRELVERALAAPGADAWLDAGRIHRRLDDFADGTSDSPSVELLMRVVNMGLLAEMATTTPRLESMDAGAVPSELRVRGDLVAEAQELFEPRRSHDLTAVPVTAKEFLLLSHPDGDWYLANDGQIEFVLEADSPIVRVLRRIDGTSTLATVLSGAEVPLDAVEEELNMLVDQRILLFVA